MIKSILAALSFLTIIPIKSDEFSDHDLSTAPVWFPLVGFFIGAICPGIAVLLQGLIGAQFCSFLIILIMAVITGGLHIDGLADWADSLAGRTKERRLQIMRDTHHGSYGLIAVVLLLLGKFIVISMILEKYILIVLVIAPGLARLSMNLIITTTGYARSGEGTGRFFADNKQKWHLLVAAILAIAPLFALTLNLALISGSAVIIISLLFRWYGIKKLGGFTGDLLGACSETCELALLFAAAVISV